MSSDLQSKKRKTDDGCFLPRRAPRLKEDGTYARPCGRAPPETVWDAVIGKYIPVAKMTSASSNAISSKILVGQTPQRKEGATLVETPAEPPQAALPANPSERRTEDGRFLPPRAPIRTVSKARKGSRVERDAERETRKTQDGCLRPMSPPKKTAYGSYARPRGRCPPGMFWDSRRGIFAKREGDQQESPHPGDIVSGTRPQDGAKREGDQQESPQPGDIVSGPRPQDVAKRESDLQESPQPGDIVSGPRPQDGAKRESDQQKSPQPGDIVSGPRPQDGATRESDQQESPQPGDIVSGPRPQDVASTKDRTYTKHPQNVFYLQLIAEVASTAESGNGSCRKTAERIIDIITIDKGGVFCKEISRNSWIVMNRKDVLTKVQQAIRNKYSETQDRRREKQNEKRRSKKHHARKTITTYEAQAGTETTIHPYALKLISAVCNVPHPRQALHVLDCPLSQCFSQGEPPKERKMRLQLRHRYAGALAMKITPVSFSKDLLALWGGSLVKKEIPSGSQASAQVAGGDRREEAIPDVSVLTNSENDCDETSEAEALESSLSQKESMTDDGITG